jgi:hypothetical protein
VVYGTTKNTNDSYRSEETPYRMETQDTEHNTTTSVNKHLTMGCFLLALFYHFVLLFICCCFDTKASQQKSRTVFL